MSISLDWQCEMLWTCFFLYVQIEVHLLKLRCWPIAFILYKTFLKNKKRSGTCLHALFFAWFLRKNSHILYIYIYIYIYIYMYIYFYVTLCYIYVIYVKMLYICFINWPNFIGWLSLLLEILGIMCFVVI